MCLVQSVKVHRVELVAELRQKLPGQVVVAENRNGNAIFTFGLANYCILSEILYFLFLFSPDTK